ncbi:MAG: DNA-3-methyladenine glycosylase [Patulibacter sp.]
MDAGSAGPRRAGASGGTSRSPAARPLPVADLIAAAELEDAISVPASLPRSFYDRPVVEVARDLLGCTVVHRGCTARIVETEAYHESEPACHAYGRPPRPTRRTAPLFGPPGHAYVYRSYGLHAMLNAVCEPDGTAAAVLIRAVEPLAGLATIRRNRLGREDRELTSGPGKLAQALAIGFDLDRSDLVDGPLRIAQPVPGARPVKIVSGVRVGITKAADLPWRFADATSPFVSRPRVAPATAG